MILNSNILNKVINSEYIKNIYPMVKEIDTDVKWDGDLEFPFYNIKIYIYVNDPEMTAYNMYERGMDPHYLVDNHLIYMLSFIGISRSHIHQIYINVIGDDGEYIYPPY